MEKLNVSWSKEKKKHFVRQIRGGGGTRGSASLERRTEGKKLRPQIVKKEET